MITREKALELMEQFQAASLKNMKNVNEAIKISASMGNGCVTFFYPKKTAVKLKSKLRSVGFFVESLTFSSMPEEELVAVTWDNRIRSGEEVNRYIEE